MTLLQNLSDILCLRTDISKGEFYFVLSSVMMYFRPPLKGEAWNQFKVLVEKQAIPLSEAIFMTDEEKNPHVWSLMNKKTRQEFQSYLTECLFATRKHLLKRYPGLHKKEPVHSSAVCIPDTTDCEALPTFFPVQYIKTQLKNKVYTNELTGQPFSWTTVEKINKNESICTIARPKTVSTDAFQKIMTRELAHLQKLTTHCIHCKRKSTGFKSIKNYQAVFFCSLKCMNDWDFEEDR